MRKTLVYFVLLVLLGFGTWYFIFNNKSALYTSNEADFTIKDTASIGKIFIAGPNGHTILAERTDSGWIVNKQYKALRSTVNMVLTTFYQQEALYPVPEAKHNNVVTTLAGNGIKVELYNLKGDKIRTYYVGSETNDMKGTYMLMEGAKQPYVVNKQGFQGYITPNYTYELEDWRERIIFQFPPDQIKSVSVTYPAHELNSFVLTQTNSNITVNGSRDIIGDKTLNDRRAKVYLKYFQDVYCEGHLVHVKDVDSMLGVLPKRATMDVTGTKGQHQHIDIYWLPLNRRSKNFTVEDPEIDSNKYDADRMIAVANNYKDTMIVQTNIFKKLFRKLYEFYQGDNEEIYVAPPGQERKEKDLMPAVPRTGINK
jgi:hypothetical protein